MPKFVKRLLLGLLILFVLIIGALAAIPYFFQDEILAEVKKTVNEGLNATVDFGAVDMSLLRDFPAVSLRVDDYSVTGTGEFEGVKLVSGKSFDVSVDFWSAWDFGKVPLKIQKVALDRPEIMAIILPDGKTNWDIAKPVEGATADNAPFQIELKKYSISDGHITFDDRQGGTFVQMTGLDHEGKGDFSQDVFDLDTDTQIDAFTAKSGGVTYLKKAKVDFVAGFNMDVWNSKFTLRENKLKINDLELNADGFLVTPADGSIDMDLTFGAPESDFKSLLSMVPNAYIEGFENVKAGGTFSLAGSAKGKFSASPESYPAFKIDLKINDGNVQYPDLPMGISGINTAVNVHSPTSNLDQMIVDVSSFKMNIGKNPIEGFFKLRTPISDPDVDTKIKGKLNLGDLSRAFPMEGVKTLDGTVDMDILARTKMSTIDREDYANVDMSGNATIQNVNYVADGMPPVHIMDMGMFFTPQNVQVPNFDMRLGKSDLRGKARVDNILAFFSPDATMRGDVTLRSNYFNADEWVSDSPEPTATPSSPAGNEEEVFNRFDFTMDGEIGKMDYDVYQLKDLKAKGNFTPSKLTATDLSGKIGESDFAVSGVLTNVWNFIFKDETLGGNLNLRSRKMNLNQFMTEGETTAAAAPSAAEEPILVPGNMDLKMNADIGTVIYDNMELKNVSGGMTVANEAVVFDDLTANSLGGKMAIRGGYDTKDHDKPVFDLGMQLRKIDFQKAFNTFNTFQAIAPIGKYMEGTFNTNLSMNSALGKDLMPDLSTLSIDGLLHTINGAIKGFAPLENVANKLNVDAFKNITLTDTKNWFTVKDGKLELEEFDHKYEDIAMKIGGGHFLTGDMDYHIDAKIPREKIGKNPLGAAANSGLEMLGSQASKLGLDLNAGEFVNVRINILGTMTDPKIKVKLLGTEGGSGVKDAVVESVKEEAGKVLSGAKAEAQKRAEARKKQLEELAKKKAKAEADKLADKAKKEAEKKLNDEAKKAADKAAKKVGEKVGDEAKKKLEEWNPFGKKKKGGGR